MCKVRVIVAIEPRLLRESLCDLIERQPDMEVVNEATAPLDLLLAVRQTHAHAVIVSLQEPRAMPGICSHLLAENPDLVVLAVTEKGRDAVLYRRDISTRSLAQVSAETVLDTLRRALAPELIAED